MNLKRETFKALAAYLESKIPELVGKTTTVWSDEEDPAAYPCLAILPAGGFTFESEQEEVVDLNIPGKIIVEVGTLEGVVELRLAARNICERQELEQKIIDAFMARELSPGLVTAQIKNIQVGGLQTTIDSNVAFALDKVEWREEFAFAGKRYSFLEVDAFLNVYAARDAYRMNDLRLALTEDMSASNPAVEEYKVAEDGSLTEV